MNRFEEALKDYAEWDQSWIDEDGDLTIYGQESYGAVMGRHHKTIEYALKLAAKMERKAMQKAIDLVLEQAEDNGLWFVPQTITEDYLQQALRRLHDAVERDGKNRP
jgi:TRAP-type C4-dicarboxylate transport system substrate-binding protein